MSDGVTVHIDGLAQLGEQLAELVDNVQRNMLRRAASAGMAVIRDQIRANAPVWQGPAIAAGYPPAGTMKKAVFMMRVNENTPGRVTYIAGVRHGKSRQSVGKKGRNLDAFYFQWVEKGHYTRPAGGGIIARGGGRAAHLASGAVATYVLPQPFMRNSFDQKKEAAVSTFSDTLRGDLFNAVNGNRGLLAFK